MKRLTRIFAASTLLIGVLVGLTSSTSTGSTDIAQMSTANSRHEGPTIRWDVVDIDPQTLIILAGGKAASQDPSSHDTLTLTSTGQAEPRESAANGGGTFVHRNPDGSIVARGIYVVRRFVSWTPLPGSLIGTPLIDGIGEKDEARSGILTVRIALYVGGNVVRHARLTVHCALPGAPDTALEGVTVKVHNGPSFTAITDNGPTLFHVL